jgi:hypothetical protein
MANKQRLELTWIGKENRPKLEPRILLEEPENSYHAAHRISKKDIHAQMQEHFWEEIGGFETKINAGFTELKPSAYTVSQRRRAGLPLFATGQEQHGKVPVRGVLPLSVLS